MEFGRATLNNPVSGKCGGCNKEAELSHVIAEIKRDSTKRDSMGHPTISLTKGHLICGDCAAGPLWRE